MAILENKGSPNITLGMPVVTLSGYAESIIPPGDINGDGKVDLMVGSEQRKIIFLKNNAEAGDHLSTSTFEKFAEYGTSLVNSGSGTVDTRITINDLNGDGRPEVITSNAYNFGPHDGYMMEIWQNSTPDCLDPSLITVKASRNAATIGLPPNTTLDQFEIEYAQAGSTYWTPIYSTTLSLWAGSYQLRARAKCYLGFTEYYYLNFVTDCVDTNNLYISSIGATSIIVQAPDIGSFEIQYSPTGEDQWKILPIYVNQISDLLPGTKYDLRFRGRWCNPLAEFTYKEFTTSCPTLNNLVITDLKYNRAVVGWTSIYPGTIVLEYSTDHTHWIPIDETRTMFPLSPGTNYYVRGRMLCPVVNSDFSYLSFTTPCPKVSMLGANTITPRSATINWVDDSGTGHYNLKYSLTAGGTVTTVETYSTSFNLTGLAPGSQYTVSVAPQCLVDKEFISTTFYTDCYVPFDFSASNITHTTADLSWAEISSGLPYLVDYSIKGSNVWQTIETQSTTMLLSKLRPGTEYEVRLYIRCGSKTPPYISLLFETNLYEETTLAPNPTDDKITISPSKDIIGNRFSIHDSAGRIVAQGELLSYTLDLSVFSAGLYTLRIEGEKPMKIVKR